MKLYIIALLAAISYAQTDCVVNEVATKAKCTSVCGTVSYEIATQPSPDGTACPTGGYFCRKGDGDCDTNYSPKMAEESATCACIGEEFTNSDLQQQTNTLADYVTGGTTATDKLLDANYGALHCKAWDADEDVTPYPACTDDLADFCGDENWCTLKWCYVNYACVQDSNVITARSNAFDDVVMYYSYRHCGTPDCFASANNVGCPFSSDLQTCPHTCDSACGGYVGDGSTYGKTLDGNYWAGFQGAQADAFTALQCVPCGEVTTGGTDPIVTNSTVFVTQPDVKCRVCPTTYDATKICTLPAEIPTGYKYGVAKRITGACTTETCHEDTGHVDVFCADDYELYNGNTITLVGCTDSTASRDVGLRGCIPKGPSVAYTLTEVTVGTTSYKLRLFECDESSDCSIQGWCDTYFSDAISGDDPAGHCRACPYSSAECDANDKYSARQECKDRCFPTTNAVERKSCTGTLISGTADSATSSWDFGVANCESGEYCFLNSAPRTTNGAVYDGYCTICEIDDPRGEGQCSDLDHFYRNLGSQKSCVDECTLTGATERTSISPPVTPFVRFSQMETMVGGKDMAITPQGACGQYVYTPSVFPGTPGSWGWDNFYWQICTYGYPDEISSQSWLTSIQNEVDSATGSGPCARRYCEMTQAEYVAEIQQTSPDYLTTGVHNAKANRCLVEIMKEGTPCTTTIEAKTNTVFEQNGQSKAILAGKCNANGICIIEDNAECPPGSTAKTTTFTLDNCSNSPRGRQFETTFYGNRANDANGNFNFVPVAKSSECKSHSHLDNGEWEIVGWSPGPLGGNAEFFPGSTGGNITYNWGRNVNGPVDTYFNWMIFSQYYMYPANISGQESVAQQTVEFEAIGASTVKTGVGIICDPSMSDSLKDRYQCIIQDTGLYEYHGANISVFENSNSTTRTYEISIEPLTFTYYNVFICPGVHTNLCFGEFQCTYSVGDTTTEDYQNYCKGSFTECEPAPYPSLDPTMDPTMDPTSPPTTITTTSTAHGDPIIWTFYEECYDLNKDGLYDATVNPRFDHTVKIGVYNDFMRELVVVDDNDNIMISINSLGEYEHDEKNWPHAFSFEEKDCPAEMKQTECLGTYKEWIFDAQEFRYTVHLLRHDYKDNGIPEGDLGWHLDIYPKPYSGFYKAGHMDSYSGLFFENPLPQELEYCEGGSPRNDGTQ